MFTSTPWSVQLFWWGRATSYRQDLSNLIWPLCRIQSIDCLWVSHFPSESLSIQAVPLCILLSIHWAGKSVAVSAYWLHASATSLLACPSLCNPQQLSSSRAGRWELLCKPFALDNDAQKSTLKELSCCTLQHCYCVLKIPHGHSKTRANRQLLRPVTMELWENMREELRFCFLAVFVACLFLFLL